MIKGRSLKKSLGTALAIVLALSGNFLPAVFAQSVPATAVPISEGGVLDGVASIKAIGPLHLSEGKVVMKDNEIRIYSDATDAKEDAELTGAIIEAHTKDDASGRTIKGEAIFTSGFSLPTIYDPKVKESVMCTDGIERVGRIVDVTPKMLRIKTDQGVQAIPNRYITIVKSPRAYSFSVPLPKSSTASTAPSQETSAADPLPHIEHKLISFSPTYTPDPNASLPASSVTALHAQLTKKHTGKRVVKLAAVAAGVLACFAIPVAIGFACPPPSHFVNNNGN